LLFTFTRTRTITRCEDSSRRVRNGGVPARQSRVEDRNSRRSPHNYSLPRTVGAGAILAAIGSAPRSSRPVTEMSRPAIWNPARQRKRPEMFTRSPDGAAASRSLWPGALHLQLRPGCESLPATEAMRTSPAPSRSSEDARPTGGDLGERPEWDQEGKLNRSAISPCPAHAAAVAGVAVRVLCGEALRQHEPGNLYRIDRPYREGHCRVAIGSPSI